MVTHICTVIGGFPRPRLSWHSLNHFSSIEEYYDNKTRKNILEIQINISKSYHDYEIKCVADHEAWSIPMDKLSTPILIQSKHWQNKYDRFLKRKYITLPKRWEWYERNYGCPLPLRKKNPQKTTQNTKKNKTAKMVK